MATEIYRIIFYLFSNSWLEVHDNILAAESQHRTL